MKAVDPSNFRNIIHQKCVAHTLNLVVIDAANKIDGKMPDGGDGFLVKCRALASHVRRSTLTSDHLKALHTFDGTKPRRLVTNCPTRFGSIPDMLDRLDYNKKHLIEMMQNSLTVISAYFSEPPNIH